MIVLLAGRWYVPPIGCQYKPPFMRHCLVTICNAVFDGGRCEPQFGERVVIWGWRWVPSVAQCCHSNRFCSAPTCHGQTDGWNWSSKWWYYALKCISCPKLKTLDYGWTTVKLFEHHCHSQPLNLAHSH